MPIMTVAPKAYRLFKAMDGREFANSTEFADAFQATYAELFRGSPSRNRSDVLTWGLESGVLQRHGQRLTIRVTVPPPAY